MFIFVTSFVLFYYVFTVVLQTSVAGLLARSQYPEGPGPATSAQIFLGFPVFKANFEMVPKTPSCYCMLLM